MNNSTQQAAAPSGTFLPPPRLPYGSVVPDVEVMTRVAGPDLVEPLTEFNAHLAAVSAAIEELEDNRPGGAGWGAALKADAKKAASDAEPPKVWATERLLAGDANRWARASALARTIGTRRTALRERLDLAAIEKAATEYANVAWEDCRVVALHGWRNRSDRAVGWAAYRDSEAAIARYREGIAVVSWCQRGKWTTPSNMSAYPGGEAGGAHWALHYFLHPEQKFTGLPQGVVLPADVDVSTGAAVGRSGEDLRTKGWSETPDPPSRGR